MAKHKVKCQMNTMQHIKTIEAGLFVLAWKVLGQGTTTEKNQKGIYNRIVFMKHKHHIIYVF